jgi:tripartite-type tricarboxylate transporter receptor subunit TctC
VLDTVLTANPALYKNLPFDPERDFRPISIVASYAQMLVVHPSVPVNTVAEFVAFARSRNDRPLTYATGGGNGSPGHLTMEYFRAQAGFPALQVPYKGAAPAVTDLVAGQVQSAFGVTAAMLPHVKEGQLRAIAVSSIHRTRLAPDVPTIAEAGYPGFNTKFYFVMLVPARQALKSPDLREKLRAQSLEPVASTGIEATALLKTAAERWMSVIRAADIKSD